MGKRMQYKYRLVKLFRYILHSAIFVAIFWNSNIIAQSKQEKIFPVSPPTIDPTYGMAKPAPKHSLELIAKWIWAAHTSDTQTIYVRKTFNLKMKPHSADLYVTADDRFAAWVNGHLIGVTTDTSGDLVWTHVQQFSINTYLQKGRNVISIRGVNKADAAGILAMLKVNGSVCLITGESWKVLDQPTHPELWNTITFNDFSWKNVTVIAPYGSGSWGDRLVDWPGKGIDQEYLAHIPISPKKVTVLSGKRQITGAETLAGRKNGHAVIYPGSEPDNTKHVLLFDFGQELSGRLQVCGTQGVNVIVTTGESVQECNHEEPSLDNHGPFSLTLHGTRLASTPYTAFRYAAIQYNGSTPLNITKVLCDFKYYPVQYKGSFNCSDSLLTRIWYTGAYTAHLCMQEDIWDAPKRDRGLWIGDMQVSGQTINVAFGDRFLMERSIERVRDQAQGGRPDTELPISEVNSIPGYSAAWFCILVDYYLHQGDKALLSRQHAKIISLLEYLKTDFDNNNLFNNPHKAWDYCDWSPDFIIDGPLTRATTDLYIILGVRQAIYLLDQLGDKTNSERFAQWESQLIQAARSNLYDAQIGSFSERLQENVMAILSDVAAQQQDSIIYSRIIKPGSPAWIVPKGTTLSDSEVMSPYYGYFVLSAMDKLHEYQDALNLLRNYWGDMLSRGTSAWWEMFDPSWPRDFNWVIDRLNYVSLSHGWSSGPTSFLTEHILGVRPTSAGYDNVNIQPNLCDLKWMEGNIPTPHGIIYVKAFRQKSRLTVRVMLPAGIRAHIVLPGVSRDINRRGQYTVISKE
jgi:hypothetical protein